MEILSDTDPYEIKLFHMFQSHDVNRVGCLDREALIKLCKTLELKERGQLLVNNLLQKPNSKDKQNKVTFIEFRQGLLNFLDTNMNAFISSPKTSTDDDDATTATTTIKLNKMTSDNESSDREVSPKFIVGTKKYGRRSRPRDNNDESSLSDSDNENVAIAPSLENRNSEFRDKSPKVQRSASQSDMHGSKRRRPTSGTRLKRCASLPAQKSNENQLSTKVRQSTKTDECGEKDVRSSDIKFLNSKKKFNYISLSANLQEVWNSFGCLNNYLNISQLAIVCEKIGLNKTASKLAAREVFEKLSLNTTETLSFEEFMSLLQSNSDILSGVNRHDELDAQIPKMNNSCHLLKRDLSDISLNNDFMRPEIGSLPASIIIDMWESAGITDASNLLLELGFYGDEVLINDLTIALDEEVLRVDDDKQISSLLKSSLALHKAEVNALRQAFLQLVDENKKLHIDSKEANRRVILLTQEVDDRHSSIENLSKIEIQQLEQKHNETIKVLTSQLSAEREHWSNSSVRLEEKLKSYEIDETKMKNQMSTLQDEYSALEIEQVELQKQITELLETNIRLNREISDYEENEKHDLIQNEKANVEMLELIDKISALQTENTNLRDKGDELCAEIEDLNLELSKFKIKKPIIISHAHSMSDVSPPEDISDESITCIDFEQISSGATKRRGDSPSKTRIVDDSPRLGKFRKCSNDTNNNDDSEVSGEWIALQSELGTSMKAEKNTSGVSSVMEEEHRELQMKIKELEKTIAEMKINSNKVEPELSPKTIDQSEFSKLKAQVKELESSLEQMRKEYEDCEDYWQSKLNEERLLYEEEQRVSDDKFTDLVNKMSEYEALFTNKDDEDKYGRLSPIEEKCVLEQQYIELEQELEDTKLISQHLLDEKSAEITSLRCQIEDMKSKMQRNSVSPLPTRIETTDLDSPASSPVQYLWNQSTIQAVSRDYHNPSWQKNVDRIETNEKLIECKKDDFDTETETTRIILPIQKPTSLNLKSNELDMPVRNGSDHVSCDKADGACDVASVISVKSNYSVNSANRLSEDSSRYTPEDLKTIEKKMCDEIRDLAHQRDCLVMELQQLHEAKPILAKAYARASHSNLTQRIQQLEQKNRHLQSVLKQQQQYAETIYHQTWQQQRAEISELRNHLEAQSIVISEQAQRLANADHLVKDLYVENSHLTATIQRLEQQRTRNTLLQLSQHHLQQGLSGVPGMP